MHNVSPDYTIFAKHARISWLSATITISSEGGSIPEMQAARKTDKTPSCYMGENRLCDDDRCEKKNTEAEVLVHRKV